MYINWLYNFQNDFNLLSLKNVKYVININFTEANYVIIGKKNECSSLGLAHQHRWLKIFKTAVNENIPNISFILQIKMTQLHTIHNLIPLKIYCDI